MDIEHLNIHLTIYGNNFAVLPRKLFQLMLKRNTVPYKAFFSISNWALIFYMADGETDTTSSKSFAKLKGN